MPRTALVLRHLAFEDLGLLGPVLAEAGYQISYREPALEPGQAYHRAGLEADLLIVLGGPIGAYEDAIYPFLKDEAALIAARLDAERPLLGICLGAQLMAQALGAKVYPGGVKEIGWGKVTLSEAGAASALAPLADEAARVLHWHGDTFDLPAGAVRLASNAVYPNQAFSYGAALGLQFHLEADPARIEQWLVGHALELAKAGIDIPALRAQTQHLAPKLEAQANTIFTTWLDGL